MNFNANACNESRAISFDNASPLILPPAHIKGQPGRNHTGEQKGARDCLKITVEEQSGSDSSHNNATEALMCRKKTKSKDSFNVRPPQ